MWINTPWIWYPICVNAVSTSIIFAWILVFAPARFSSNTLWSACTNTNISSWAIPPLPSALHLLCTTNNFFCFSSRYSASIPRSWYPSVICAHACCISSPDNITNANAARERVSNVYGAGLFRSDKSISSLNSSAILVWTRLIFIFIAIIFSPPDL